MYNKKKIFTLGERRAEALKEICKEENIIWRSSYYGGRRFGFKISKEWSEKYPDLISKKDENVQTVYDNDAIISQYFQVLCCSIINNDIANQIGLNKNHIRLLKRSYYEYDTIDEDVLADKDDEIKTEIGNAVGVLYLAYKRPFGNSNVISDILEEFDIPTVDGNGDAIDKNWEEEYDYLLEETVQKIKDFFIYHPFDSNLQVEYQSYRFKPTIGYLRKHKIEKILKTEK